MNEYIQLVRQRNASFAAVGEKRYACVVTFGCQQNEADSEKLRGMADAMGYTVTEDVNIADLIVVNTCAVREHAELKALSTIGQYKHLKAKNPDLLIGVCGCMVAQKHRVEELKNSYPYVSFSFEPSSLDRFPQILYEALEKHGRKFSIGENAREISEGVPVLRESSFKAWVSIMYGCNNFCSYCIVPYVRDRERSRAYTYVVEEVKELVASGVKEITLLGQNVNSYSGGCTFAELLEKLAAIEGDFLIRFMTSHPKDVSDELIEVMAKSPRIAKQFHLPIQSGSDTVLKAMNRRYNTARYLATVEKLRAAMPNITLTTDIIVGFPGETEEDFEATLTMLRTARFDMIYSFIYSPRSGTPAAKMENQVPDAVKSERMQRLLALQNQISLEKNADAVGKTLRVLAEGPSKNDPETFTGRAESNKLVHFKAEADCIGKFVHIKIDRAEPFCLQGDLINK
ncbi:MAG: tRNA (N6-isopentenyl adenosine(37)-C2)-methylthiotransferase MiaB [Clostridia bacterium]|nr:tRNA (N6-isopentenyl adenosine(37)-C2)-methylthiotransferase MiaB [Clostridia bacterium]